jgi:hypothetical protein
MRRPEGDVRDARPPPVGSAIGSYEPEPFKAIVADFFDKGSARDLDVTCVQTLRRPPFLTELS